MDGVPSEHIRGLVSELPQLLEEIEAIVEVSHSEWNLVFEGGQFLRVVADDEASMVTFESSIGELPVSNRDEILEGLLRANAMWFANKGTIFELLDSNHVMQTLHIFAELDITGLVAVVRDQRTMREEWEKNLPDLTAVGPEFPDLLPVESVSSEDFGGSEEFLRA